MKYIKKFNESNDSELSELQEFFTTHLIELVDNNFNVIVKDKKNEFYLEIDLPKKENLPRERFKYSDIKDKFITFINVLSDNYDIIGDIFFGFGFSYATESIDNIINDDVNKKLNEDGIEWIEIVIRK